MARLLRLLAAPSQGRQAAMPPLLEVSATRCRYVGGIAGTDSGLFGYFVLALFWAPSSCTANNSALGGFCSNFTGAGSYAAHNLVLHGERLMPVTGRLPCGKYLLGIVPVLSAFQALLGRALILVDAWCASEPRSNILPSCVGATTLPTT